MGGLHTMCGNCDQEHKVYSAKWWLCRAEVADERWGEKDKRKPLKGPRR